MHSPQATNEQTSRLPMSRSHATNEQTSRLPMKRPQATNEKTSAETFGRKVGLGLGPVELQRGGAFQPKSKVSSVTDAVVGSRPPMALAGPDGPASTLGRPEVRVRGPESPIPVSGNDGSS